MGTSIQSTPLRILAAAGTMGLTEAGGLLPLAKTGLRAIIPAVPAPPATPAAPTTEDTAVQQAVSEARQRRARARGFRSTILSQHLLAAGGSALKTTLGS